MLLQPPVSFVLKLKLRKYFFLLCQKLNDSNLTLYTEPMVSYSSFIGMHQHPICNRFVSLNIDTFQYICVCGNYTQAQLP